MNKKILAIINPVSSGGKTAKIWPNMAEHFKKEFNNFSEIYTQAAGDAIRIAKEAVEADYDYLLAVGGDGTVNEIINGMLLIEDQDINTKLIIYAQGTGSDLSRTLKLPKKIDKFINLIKREKSKKIKVIEAEFLNLNKENEKRFFINIADCGMGAEVAKKLNQSQKNIDGSLSYLLKIFQTLWNYKNKEVEIKSGQKLIYKGRLNTAIVANGNYFGGGIKIAPEADLYSDKLNLILLKDFSKLGIVLNLIKGYKGNHLSHPLVESFKAKKIEIKTKDSVELELDGESVGRCNASFKVSNRKISVLI